MFLLYLGCALVAAHLALVVAKPTWADGLIYPIIGLAVLLCSAIFYLQSHAAAGATALRWQLFAIGLGISSIDCIRGGLGVFLGIPLNSVDVVLQAACGTVIIVALTMPSASRSVPERSLDVFMAFFFCGLRIVYLNSIISPRTDTFTLLTHFTFESAISLLLGLIALAASSRADLVFFRSAALYLAGSLVSCVCTNDIGFLWLRQHEASPWSLTATALRVGIAVYLLHGLITPTAVPISRPQRELVRSLVPFVMSCLVVWLSTALLPAHHHLGQIGITLGIVGFLARTGLRAMKREDATPGAIRARHEMPIANELMSLSQVKGRAGLEHALASSEALVSTENPLSLVLLDVAEAIQSDADPEHADDHLFPIARHLSQWGASDSTLCYLGNARFGLLLPATSLYIANALAEQVCAGVEGLRLRPGEERSLVYFGVAAASSPADVHQLVHAAAALLAHSRATQEGLGRAPRFKGDLAFDA